MPPEQSAGASASLLSSREAEMSPPRPEAWIGTVLDGRYELLEVIGEGGFGVVFRAKHRSLGRDVAVKVLFHSGGGDPMARARFEREAALLATLTHPHIVTVTDFGVAEGTPYLVMELVTGRNLRELIDAGEVGLERGIGIVHQILKALAYAHEQGIVHRDLKPTNVVVQRVSGDDHIKLFDFGFAKFFGETDERPENALTARGTAVGTAGYIAPEQLGSIAVDGRADLFAAAVLLFEMITGRRPFQQPDGSSIEELRATLLSTPPKIAALRPELALVPDLDAWIARGLAKDPNERFATATEMAQELEHVLSHGSDASFSPETAGAPVQTATESAVAPTAEESAATSYAVDARDALAQTWERSKGPNAWMIAGMIVLPAALFALVVGTGIALFSGVFSSDAEERAEFEEVPETADESVEEAEFLLGPAIGDRPAPRDPWLDSVPPELAEIRARIDAGEELRVGDRKTLEQRARTEPWDPRPHLLFAYSERARGQSASAIQAYERAYRAAPSSRGDRVMLRDLLVLSVHSDVGARAANAVVHIYGSEVLPALERTLEAARVDPQAHARLLSIRDRVSR